MESNEENQFSEKIDTNKELITSKYTQTKEEMTNTTLSLFKIRSTQCNQKFIDNGSKISSDYLSYKALSRLKNPCNNIRKMNYIKKSLRNNCIPNDSVNFNNIELDNQNLRLISSKLIPINNLSMSDGGNINYSELFQSNPSNNNTNKKYKPDLVKYKFLQSQRNYFKRISNLHENRIWRKKLDNIKLKLKEFKKYSSKLTFFLLQKTNKEAKKEIKPQSKIENYFPSKQKYFPLSPINAGFKTNSTLYLKSKNEKISKININKCAFKTIRPKINFFTPKNDNNKIESPIEDEKEDNFIIKSTYNNFAKSPKLKNDYDINYKENNLLIKAVNKNFKKKIMAIKKKNPKILDKKDIFSFYPNKTKLILPYNNKKENRNEEHISYNEIPLLKINKINIDNDNNSIQLNKNILFNSLLREKLLCHC